MSLERLMGARKVVLTDTEGCDSKHVASHLVCA
jgi:hypothetical protein